MNSFPCLYVEATIGDHLIEVYYCCCPSGLLGGIDVRRGGLYGLYMIGFVQLVILFLFPTFSFTSRLP